MSTQSDNDIWLNSAHRTLKRKRDEICSHGRKGPHALYAIERLTYWLLTARFSQVTEGNFHYAYLKDRYFKNVAADMAKELSLPYTYRTFLLNGGRFESEWNQRYNRICDEIRASNHWKEWQ